MAKLPGYDSKVEMTAQPASVQRDIQQEQQYGRDLSTIGKAASDIAKVWQDAKDFEETLNRKNYLDNKTQEIMIRAEEEPDYKNNSRYDQDLAKLKEEALQGFSNNLARDKFSLEVQNQTAQTQIKLDSMFRAKMVDTVKGEIIESHEYHKKEFIRTGDHMNLAMQQAVVNGANQRGIVNDVFVANEAIKIEEWKNLRYLQMAQEGRVKEALQMIDQSDMQPSEKNAAKSAIVTMSQQNAIVAQVNKINNEQKMYAEANAVVDDPNRTFVDKLSFLEQQRKFGMPASDYTELIGALTSKHSVAAESHASAKTEIALAITKLDGGLSQKKKGNKDVKEYLESLKATRKLITQKAAEGVITRDDKTGFLADLDKATKEETSIAASKMNKQKLAWWFADYAVYGYDDAYKDIQDQLENKVLSDEAFLEIYYADRDKKMTSKDRKAKVSEVVDKYNSRLAAEIKRQMRENIGLSPAENKVPDAEFLKEIGWTEETVQRAMEEDNASRDAVIEKARQMRYGK